MSIRHLSPHRRPRHRRPSPPPPLPPSDIVLLALSALTLLVACFVIGGLMAHPF